MTPIPVGENQESHLGTVAPSPRPAYQPCAQPWWANKRLSAIQRADRFPVSHPTGHNIDPNSVCRTDAATRRTATLRTTFYPPHFNFPPFIAFSHIRSSHHAHLVSTILGMAESSVRRTSRIKAASQYGAVC
jgi:hypothetical protein